MIKLTNLTKYIEELKKLLMKNDVDFYDFHKTQSVEKSNCEFIDGLHGGDVLYAKMLLYIHKKEPLLNDYVNKDYLEIVSERFKDMAMIPRPSLFSEPEIDFMKISCQKKPKNFIHNS